AFNVNEEKKLFSAISYAYANGGKRLRPVLALLTAEAVMQRSQNAEIGVQQQCHNGTVAERASSRPRRTNDRSVLQVHEDHEDDENAEIGVRQQCLQERNHECTFMYVVKTAKPNSGLNPT
ncbi:MAG: hypothetical protein ACKO3R_05345, partial [bacterium]